MKEIKNLSLLCVPLERSKKGMKSYMKRIKVFILTLTSLLMRTISMFFGIYISKKIGTQAVGVFGLIMSVYMFFITLATSRNKFSYY